MSSVSSTESKSSVESLNNLKKLQIKNKFDGDYDYSTDIEEGPRKKQLLDMETDEFIHDYLGIDREDFYY